MKTITLPPHSKMCSSDFVYGVATASFQIEGDADGRLKCIWDTFCDMPGAIRDGSNGDIACDHVTRWREDLELIASLGVDAYRFSISWPRVLNRDGSVNEAGIRFYIRILDTLNNMGIKPFVTLYHWDLPQYLEDQGGWLNRDTAYRFAEYVEIVSQQFGDRVYSYATLNEPFCSAYLGYEVGIHAPGLKGKEFGKKAAHHLLLAHGLAMNVLRKNAPKALLGVVVNASPYYPESDSTEDKQAAELADQHMNQWYIRPLLEGCYPDLINSLPDEHKPQIQAGDMGTIGQKIDFIGINYYTREIVRASSENDFEQQQEKALPLTDMGWEIYPQGLTDLLLDLHRTYALPPVYLTENGAAMPDVLSQGKVDDQDRLAYFQGHLAAVHQAIELGVNINGYFAWSLMDNFEWAEGYEKRFGIVHVDYQTQVRTIKASGYAYRDFVVQRRSIPHTSASAQKR